MVMPLKYGNTNTYFIRGEGASLLCDTDYAGTLGEFFRQIKVCGLKLSDITYVMATHYHPDHVGLISELMGLGVRLLLLDVQMEHVHFPDVIFGRDARLGYRPIDEGEAVVISCEQSRAFLASLGIGGEIISVPSHSPDSVALILDGDRVDRCADRYPVGERVDGEGDIGGRSDGGCCIAGDLEPFEYIGAYDNNVALRADWERVLNYNPRTVYYAHANAKHFG